ncbi:hypothetical protein SLS62_010675 [Diatrype stigma]|uniref:O-methyltransferase C-terminal domain-containing protein n=1 Tax=Diatrype stigma TaxID=117547 RepID=A0AAN9UH52_9PEZI
MTENPANTALPKGGSKIRIVELAQSIVDGVAQIQTVFSDKGLPPPSFDEDAPQNFPSEAFNARDMVLDASAELYDLLLDPVNLMVKRGSVGQTTFASIAKQTGLPEQMVKRLLRHAMTMRVFREPEPNSVAHTQASKILTETNMAHWLASGTEDMWPAAVRMVDAIEKWGDSQEPNHTGFALAHNITGSIYDFVASNPERAARFSGTMKAMTSSDGYDLTYVLDHYEWASLGTARVVDIGGSQGHVSIALAKQFPDLTFVVQDMEQVVEGAGASLPAELATRVQFMAHDLFKPQTVVADVYFMRWILHNWSAGPTSTVRSSSKSRFPF